ncbi:hypothetical protein L7F22_067768 [Adiantum nelumboides]|nr:hypothetical protein [Adiantum nelumboides]
MCVKRKEDGGSHGGVAINAAAYKQAGRDDQRCGGCGDDQERIQVQCDDELERQHAHHGQRHSAALLTVHPAGRLPSSTTSWRTAPYTSSKTSAPAWAASSSTSAFLTERDPGHRHQRYHL